MGNGFFRFKQFVVKQDNTVMKVGVDSVLLGAWVNTTHARHVLDVGAGTGLLALMIAQRSPETWIDAVEIDHDSCVQAMQNVAESPWPRRIKIICENFREYVNHCSVKYDLIISNPPYFTASLKPAVKRRSIARHNDSLPHADLIRATRHLLTPEGILAVVLPPEEARSFREEALSEGLYVKRLLAVRTLPFKPVSRILMELSAKESETEEMNLCIEKEDRSDFTGEYKDLTREFYLKF